MKTLLLGYSDIARRRVLPAFRNAGVTSLDIASVSAGTVEWPGGQPPRLFRDYQAALEQSEAELVYVSTTNNLHAELAAYALQRGLHVVLDKPGCLSLKDTQRLIELAHRKRRLVAEATVYSYHPQVEMARRAFEKSGSRPTHLVGVFSMPPRHQGNFRHQARLGGGAMWDLGPYAITPGRIFFGERAKEIICRCVCSGDEVETSFSLLATYSGGRSAIGSFGFTTEYMNRLDIIGPGLTVTIPRAFSPLPSEPGAITIRHRDQTVDATAPIADTFTVFLSEVFRAIAAGEYSRFAEAMLNDAEEMNRLRASAVTDS